MAQYKTYADGEYKYWTDPDTRLNVRTGQRSHRFVEDVELITNGFTLAEGTGWINTGGQATVAGEGMMFREGARDGYYVIDVELAVGGFVTDIENTTWKLIGGAT